jgi:hypothetical protein
MRKKTVHATFDQSVLDSFAQRIETINAQIDELLADIALVRSEFAGEESDEEELQDTGTFDEEFDRLSFETQSLRERLPSNRHSSWQ